MESHAVPTMKSRREANNLIKHGILIEGTQHEVRKLEEDPKRCFKCQITGAGHTAATCKASKTCSNCARDHMTGDCKATQNEYKCAICKKDGKHADYAA